MHIPDPVEQMEANIERHINTYVDGRCPICNRPAEVLVQLNIRPDSPAGCLCCAGQHDEGDDGRCINCGAQKPCEDCGGHGCEQCNGVSIP